MTLHPWWESFGEEVNDPEGLTPDLARELVSLATGDAIAGITVSGLRQSAAEGYAGVHLDVEAERPQDLAYPIKALESIAVLFPFDGGQPSVLALREDFPDTPHQNWAPLGTPCALCIDDRPWSEARLTTTGNEILQRVQIWLSKAARGELHDTAQPPDPLFFTSRLNLVFPATVLSSDTEPVELAGYVREDNPNLILTQLTHSEGGAPSAFTVLAFHAEPQGMVRLRHAPRTLAALDSELQRCGIRLNDQLKTRLKDWAGIEKSDIRRLSTHLAIVVAFPIQEGQQLLVNDIRAFITKDPAGEVGVAAGVLHRNDSEVGDMQAYVTAIPEVHSSDQDLEIEPAQVHFELNRELAAAIAGKEEPDRRRALLVGAGSLGSQLSLNLAREGSLTWTVVDDDHMLPHNLVRHALFSDDVGAPKAEALARKIASVLGEPATAIRCDLLNPKGEAGTQLSAALSEADIIIDTSASIATSRHLSDLPESRARRMCAFLNPAGTSVVLLAESVGRSITLQDLEAQYYRIVSGDPRLSGHLDSQSPGIRYSGSCRALTNRISASNATLLSALAARGIAQVLTTDEAAIFVWTLKVNGEVELVQQEGAPVTRKQIGNWALAYDRDFHRELKQLRTARSPMETGGVLLGIADMSRRSIHVVRGLPEPSDSRGTETSFERGIVNLHEQVNRAVEATMHQIRYLGEWHSHPDGAAAMPSSTDMAQLRWLRQELDKDGLPGLMAVVASDARLSFLLNDLTVDKGQVFNVSL